MNKFISLCLFLIAFQSVDGQEVNSNRQVLPPGPLVKTDLGDFASWEIIESPVPDPSIPSTSGNASPEQNKLFTKTKPILRIQTSINGSVQEDRWIFGSVQIITGANAAVASISRPGGGVVDVDYSKSDFPELGWISQANYDSVVLDLTTHTKVIVFKTVLVIVDDTGKRTESPTTARIDLETRIPVSFQKDGMLFVYKINPMPSDKLVIPPAVSQAFQIGHQNDTVIHRATGSP